jgi:hypothetical protein
VKAISATGSCIIRSRVLVEKIRRLFQLDWEVVIHHSNCEVNQCTDALTNYNCTIRCKFEFFLIYFFETFGPFDIKKKQENLNKSN